MKRRLVEQTNECINPGNNAGEIQKFLGISVDKTFGNETAEATGTYLGYPNISTRQDLFNHLVKDYPNEFKGGIGPTAQKVIGDLLYAECQKKAKVAEEKANYRPSVTRGMWEQIMRLWDNDPDMKQQFLTIINDTVAKQMENFSYDETHTFSVKNKLYTGTAFGYYITGPPTFKTYLRVKAYNATVKLTAIEQDEGDWMKVHGKVNGTARLVGFTTKDLRGRVSVFVRIVDGNVEAQLASLKVSVYERGGGIYKFEIWPLEFRLSSNKVKLYNTTWCGGYCTSWNTGLESQAKSEVGTQTEDIMPYLKEYNIV